MEKLKIMIASPIRRRLDILAEFLHGLASIDGGEHELIFRLIDDNDDPASSELLKSFQAMQGQKDFREDRTSRSKCGNPFSMQ